MQRPRRHVLVLSVLVLGAAAVAAAAVLLLPELWVRWIPAAVGAAWTGGLIWLFRRLRREPAEPGPGSVRGGVIASGLLTLLAASWAVRGTVGWPELLLVVAALAAFGAWVRGLAREARHRRAHPPRPSGPVLGLRPPPGRPHAGRSGRGQRPTRWM